MKIIFVEDCRRCVLESNTIQCQLTVFSFKTANKVQKSSGNVLAQTDTTNNDLTNFFTHNARPHQQHSSSQAKKVLGYASALSFYFILCSWSQRFFHLLYRRLHLVEMPVLVLEGSYRLLTFWVISFSYKQCMIDLNQCKINVKINMNNYLFTGGPRFSDTRGTHFNG